MTGSRQSFSLLDHKATEALGAALAQHMVCGDVLALIGDLGAGKTTLARGFIQALCGASTEVPSPTYTLIQTYDTPKGELWHGDMYRLEKPEDGYELGLLDAFEEAICLVEWPDKLGALWPEDALTLSLNFKDEGREAVLSGAREWIGHV